MSIRKLRQNFLRIIFFYIMMASSVYAIANDDDLFSRQLIDAYMQAVRSNDPASIKSTWTTLDNNAQAKAYMQAHMPELDYLFKIRGIYLELQEYQLSRPDLFGKENLRGDFQQTVDTLQQDLSKRSIIQVEKFSISKDDPTHLRSNREIVLDSKNQPLVDNGTIALTNPNQNRRDNKEILNSRKDRFYSAKFQNVPDELVPRGSTFPKSKPVVSADVIINQASSRLILQNNSNFDQILDIYVNGALVGREIVVSSQGRRFEVYFTSGINQLRIINRPMDKVSASLEISLEGMIFIKSSSDWVIKPGQDRQWSVEVRD